MEMLGMVCFVYGRGQPFPRYPQKMCIREINDKSFSYCPTIPFCPHIRISFSRMYCPLSGLRSPLVNSFPFILWSSLVSGLSAVLTAATIRTLAWPRLFHPLLATAREEVFVNKELTFNNTILFTARLIADCNLFPARALK